MEFGENDPSTPLLGHPQQERQQFSCLKYLQKFSKDFCSRNYWQRRIPILQWLPKYSLLILLQDAIAGITVGLTSIPQGIAYAIIAGIPPQWGLYSSMFPGAIYMIFGSCKDVTVGPTAILAALVSKYVAYSTDFAMLAAFLSGCLIMLLGLLNLGFLLDFVSKPVISGFTTAAALQIAASQLKSLFRIAGTSGGTFVSAIINFFKNIGTVQLWDPILGFSTIIMLALFKKYSPSRRNMGMGARVGRGLCSARNAIVVLFGAVLAYCLQYYSKSQPFSLTGEIQGGLPQFSPPPFSTVVNNQTYTFTDMMVVFNAQGLVMPLVAILESIAIAKAFAGSTSVDASQEMIAVGACNIVCSMFQSMPVTGSFTRTAINNQSGVVTPAGGLFKGLLVLLSVSVMSPMFFWIPRATLAAIILVAMLSIITFSLVPLLWRHSKLELFVFFVTVVTGAGIGLEYGILCGALTDLLRLLYNAARPNILVDTFKVGMQECVLLILQGDLSYCSAEYLSQIIREHVKVSRIFLLLDGRHIRCVDAGVVENIVSVVLDLEKDYHKVLLWHFPERLKKLLEDIEPNFVSKFTDASNIDDYLIEAVIDRDTITNS